MRSSRTWSASACAVAAAIATLGLAGEAGAFCRSTTCSGECPRDEQNCKTAGKPLFWRSYCVGFSLHADGSEHIPFEAFEKVATDSFLAWTEVECGPNAVASIAFTRLDDVGCHKAEYNPSGPNANVILFQDHKWEYEGVNNTLAKTTVSYDTETGEILDADIELNHAFNELTVDDEDVVYDLQSILTHEIGHFIGLDHTPDFAATMNAGYDAGSTEPRTLAEDDINATCTVYTPGDEAVCDPQPRGGFTKHCTTETEEPAEASGCSIGGGVQAAPLWLSLLWLLPLRRRRWRR